MSRTYRKKPLRNGCGLRNPRTYNEIKQRDGYSKDEYPVSTRNRYIPTSWDDIVATSIYQLDYKQ